jgi:hypothetical protein
MQYTFFSRVPTTFIIVLICILTSCRHIDSNNSTPITISLKASRVSGVAPLSVFFDATGTTALATNRPFHDLEYRWDFGDLAAGKWSYGVNPTASSRNKATGGIAGHVFENPGTYTATITVTDGTNTATTTQTITVTDPDVVFAGPLTAVISVSTDFTDAPAGATQYTSTDGQTTMLTALSNGAKRVLFHRGETFTGSSAVKLLPTDTGPHYIGAYGAGAKPILRATSDAVSLLNMISPLTDWRIMDLELTGYKARGLNLNGNNLTIINIYSHDFGGNNIGGTNIAIINNKFENIPSGSGMLCLYAQDVFNGLIAGNYLNNNGGGEYNLRYQGGYKTTISNNTVLRCGDNKSSFTMRGDQSQKTYLTQYNMISDNVFDGSTCVGVATLLSICPQNSGRNEKIYDVIFERNIINFTNQTSLGITASDVTVRTNLFLSTGTGYHGDIWISYGENTNGLPTPTRNHIYNNSAYYYGTSGYSLVGTPSPLTGVYILNTEIINNFAYAPGATTNTFGNGAPGIYADGNGLTVVAQSNNSTQAQVKSGSPNFTTVPPSLTIPENWELSTGCYGIDAGTSVPIWSDFFLKPLSPSIIRDLGAIEK